jgi:arginyl-tRNA synthetase
MTHDIYASLRATVLEALRVLVPDLPDDIAARVEVTPTRDAAHGDMATNAALVAAKAARRAPAQLAGAIADLLRQTQAVSTASAAGPGFVNLSLEPAAFRRHCIRRQHDRHRHAGERRICLGQSHRPDAYRSLPRRSCG